MSKKIKELEIRLNQLGDYFIQGPEANQDEIRAYVLLVHAEIESYFEDITKEIADNAYTNWNSNRTLSTALVSLALYSECGFEKVKIELINLIGQNNNRMNVILKQALNSFIINIDRRNGIKDVIEKYHVIVKDNNGIKEVDLLRLLLPIGVDLMVVEDNWLADLNQFGTRRGNIAHQSHTKAKEILYPLSQKKLVERILHGIKDLDKALIKLYK
ncbi:MAG: hypothetical protein HQK96_00990 [Nitrospirae bacterium]|nr:hypothetical protein [Nitrospirota bacterium]